MNYSGQRFLYLQNTLRYVHPVLRTSDHSQILWWWYIMLGFLVTMRWQLVKSRKNQMVCTIWNWAIIAHYLKGPAANKNETAKLRSFVNTVHHVTRNWSAPSTFSLCTWIRRRRRHWLPIQEGDLSTRETQTNITCSGICQQASKGLVTDQIVLFLRFTNALITLKMSAEKWLHELSHSTKDLRGIWPTYTTKV